MAYSAPTHAYPYPPQPYSPQPKNGMGTTALVLGILALLASFIPLLSLFTAIPLGLLGVIFAIVGYTRITKGVATNKATTTVGLILSAIAVIVSVSLTLLVGAWLGSSDSDNGGASVESGPSGTTSNEDDGSEAQEEAAPEKRFSGQKDSDVVGEAGETLQARGVTVTAEPLERMTPSYSSPVLCSNVTYENNTADRLDYNQLDWSLQSPSGDIKTTTFSLQDDQLNSGDLAPEGSTSGLVCFDTTDETGEHVLLFEGFITFDSSRAAWINDME